MPIEVCDKCGENTYASNVVDELLSFAKNKFKPIKIIQAPVFDFVESC